ncbi:hypothetical protein [Alcanivorax sp. 1008]|uniref:hypothetical protein n=1 Tax=Alcanivorax sp. 1008 TaxID=2816853 RepID=UPI001D82FB14|nr:hypothetical protein [Alcanivorax sp. 1008]MCC1495840.1 hypothetical protein [Alcanivorax sp. 1008]
MNSNISIALDIVNDVIQTAKGTICFSRGHLQESIASGFGYKSWASFRASAKQEGSSSSSKVVPAKLSPEMARGRMRDLCPKDADSLHAILLGCSLSLDVWSRPRQPEFPGRRIYDIHASVRNHIWELDEVSTFALPIFGSPRKSEPGDVNMLDDRYIATSSRFYSRASLSGYWLDSDNNYRAGGLDFDRYLAPVKSSGFARLKNGEWKGALFINEDVEQRETDDQILNRVRGALSRSILAASSPGVRCLIYAPDGYDFGAWRVLMTLGVKALKGPWSESSGDIHFDLPQLKKRIFRLEQPFLWPYPSFAQSETKMPFGGKFEKGVFHAHLYTNGVPEEANTTRINDVRNCLIDQAELVLGI